MTIRIKKATVLVDGIAHERELISYDSGSTWNLRKANGEALQRLGKELSDLHMQALTSEDGTVREVMPQFFKEVGAKKGNSSSPGNTRRRCGGWQRALRAVRLVETKK